VVEGVAIRSHPAAIAEPSFVKLTCPLGFDFVPTDSVSLTVAVQVMLVLIGVTTGEQESVVVVDRRPTEMSVLPELG
jgi:hypothetical protein